MLYTIILCICKSSPQDVPSSIYLYLHIKLWLHLSVEECKHVKGKIRLFFLFAFIYSFIYSFTMKIHVNQCIMKLDLTEDCISWPNFQFHKLDRSITKYESPNVFRQLVFFLLHLPTIPDLAGGIRPHCDMWIISYKIKVILTLCLTLSFLFLLNIVGS